MSTQQTTSVTTYKEHNEIISPVREQSHTLGGRRKRGIFAADSLQPTFSIDIRAGVYLKGNGNNQQNNQRSLRAGVQDVIAYLAQKMLRQMQLSPQIPGKRMKVVTLFVVCAIGCSAHAFAQLKADAGPDVDLCAGYSTTLGREATGGTAPYRYSWDPPTYLNNPNIATPVVTPQNSETTYIVTVTDASNQKAYDTVVVRRHPFVKADAGSNTMLCVGATMTLGGVPSAFEGSPPYTYEWLFLPANAPNKTAPNPSYVAERTGYSQHILHVRDAFGCEAWDTVVVTVTQPINIQAGNDIDVCARTPHQIGYYGMAKGGAQPYAFSWQPTTGLSSPNIANPYVFPDTTTTYRVTVMDANGCVNYDDIVVRVKPRMVSTLLKQQTVCSGKQLTLGGSNFISGGQAPYSFTWTAPSDQTISNTKVPDPVITVKGIGKKIFTVSVIDARGCVLNDTAIVDVTESPNAEFGVDAEICEGSEVLYGVSGQSDYQYTWGILGAGGKIVRGQGTSQIVVNWALNGIADISLSVFSPRTGCRSDGVAHVRVNPLPNPKIVNHGRNILCPGETTVLEASGGNFRNYLWSNGSTATSITVTQSGDYSLLVFDYKGCQKRTEPVSIRYNVTPKPEIRGLTKICEGTTTQLEATSGFKSYLWSNGLTTPQITVSQAGSFTVTVTDDADCPGISTIHTVEMNPVKITAGGDQKFASRETEFDYPAQTVYYINADDEDILLSNLQLSPINPELTIESVDIDGRTISSVVGEVLKVGQRVNIKLKYRPMVPDSTYYVLRLSSSLPCNRDFDMFVFAQSYDKRMLSIAKVPDVFAKPGDENVKIPLSIRLATDIDSVENATLEMRVRINAYLYDPKGLTNGSITRHDTTADGWHHLWLRFDNLTVKKTSPIPLCDIVGTALATTFFSDSVYLDNMVWSNVIKKPRVQTENGLLQLDRYCVPRNIAWGNYEKTTIQIQPNPVRAAGVVSIETNIPGEYRVQIYSTEGKKLREQRLSIARGTTPVQLNAQDLPSGVYPLIITTPTHVEIMHLIIER